MAITHGLFTTYDSPYLAEDIKGLAMKIDARLTVSWDLFPEKEPGVSTDLKWYDAVRNTLDGAVRGAAWDGVATTSLGIDDNLAAIVQVGDILKVEDEYVAVSAVTSRSTGAATISVYNLGFGGTTPAAHADTTAITIIGNAQLEGEIGPDGLSEDTIEITNYYSLVEEVVEVSKTSAEQQYKDIADKVDWEREGALRRALKKMNRSVFYGRKDVGSKTTPRAAGGLEEYINTTTYGSVRIDGASAAFTEAKLQEMLKTIVLRGGAPNIILLSPKNKQIANGFNNSYVQTGRTDRTAGIIIDQYQDENAGLVAFVSDPSMRDDVVFAVNTNKLGKMYFKNDILRFVPETNVSSRVFKETLQGQYSFLVKDAAFDHGVIFDLV